MFSWLFSELGFFFPFHFEELVVQYLPFLAKGIARHLSFRFSGLAKQCGRVWESPAGLRKDLILSKTLQGEEEIRLFSVSIHQLCTILKVTAPESKFFAANKSKHTNVMVCWLLKNMLTLIDKNKCVRIQSIPFRQDLIVYNLKKKPKLIRVWGDLWPKVISCD